MTAKQVSGDPRGAPAHAATSGGFKPAADYVEGELDINQYLVRNPLATFFFAVEGDLMRQLEICDGDVLVVDRSITARHGHFVVAFVDGERLVRQLYSKKGRTELRAGDSVHKPIVVEEGTGCDLWGVVVGKFKRVPA